MEINKSDLVKVNGDKKDKTYYVFNESIVNGKPLLGLVPIRFKKREDLRLVSKNHRPNVSDGDLTGMAAFMALKGALEHAFTQQAEQEEDEEITPEDILDGTAGLISQIGYVSKSSIDALSAALEDLKARQTANAEKGESPNG